jgi:dethiobiotin synthetase
VAQVLFAYRRHYAPHTQQHLLPVSPEPDLDWVQLWQTYSDLRDTGHAVGVAYAGSLGDAVATGTTVADWARDWRLSLVLLLPLVSEAASLSVAFTALIRQAGASATGFVLWGEAGDCDIQDLTARIQDRSRLPVLGHLLPQECETETSRLTAAARLQWELLPW